MGEFTVSGDWIYYNKWITNSDNLGKDGSVTTVSGLDGLYKIKTDGTEKTKLCDDTATDINPSGNWVYYINETDGEKLYKIKTDGTGNTKVCNDGASFGINVAGDWIYYKIRTFFYFYFHYDGGLYKIKTDGTGRSKV
jgi:hypothetical protein